MDPLSIGVSTLTIIAAANSVLEIIRTLKQSRKAHRILDDLAVEIECLQCLLDQIQPFLGKTFCTLSQEALLSRNLERAKTVIGSIDILLKPPSSSKLRLSDENRASLTWFRHRTEFEGHVNNLRSIKSDLISCLAFINASISAQAADSSTASLLLQKEWSSKMHMKGNESWPPDGNEKFSTDISNISNDTAEDSRSCDENHRTPIGASEGALKTCQILNIESRLSITTKSSDGETCQSWCSCTCHSQSSFATPLLLRPLVGTFDIQCSTTQARCNEKACRRSSSLTHWKIAYHFPRFLIDRYVSFKIGFAPIDGPRIALRFPRRTGIAHPLWSIVRDGNITGLKVLFSKGLASPHDVNPRGSNALISSVNNFQMFPFLVQEGADPYLRSETGKTACEAVWQLALAGYFGDEGVSRLRALLKDTDYLETRRFTILHKIVLRILHKDLATELHDSTALIDQRDTYKRTPLFWAVIRNDTEKVNILLKYGADPNIPDYLGQSPLHFVKSLSVLRALLDASIDIDIRDSYYRRSALHSVCSRDGMTEVIEMLVDAGIDVNVRDHVNETPLLRACYPGHDAVVRKLIELGADINVENAWARDSTMHIAVHFNRHAVTKTLLANGVDYTIVDNHGHNILHSAARNGDTTTLGILTEAKLQGLDVQLRDVDGKTPAEYFADRAFFVEGPANVYEAFQALLVSVQP